MIGRDGRPFWAPIPVVLGAHDMAWALRVAQDRMRESLRLGCNPLKDGYTGDHRPIHRVGAAGELAGCNALEIPWPGSVNNFDGPDAGDDLQFRTAPCRNERPPDDFGNLAFRPDDKPDDRFILVVGNAPFFSVKGWCFGWEAPVLGEWGRLDPKRDPTWYVRWHKLHRNLAPLRYSIRTGRFYAAC